MTEKRFWLVPLDYYGECRFVRDNNRIGEKSMSNEEVVELLNVLSTENRQLKKQLETEHQQLENAILLERTRMGQSALKQYKEAIQ